MILKGHFHWSAVTVKDVAAGECKAFKPWVLGLEHVTALTCVSSNTTYPSHLTFLLRSVILEFDGNWTCDTGSLSIAIKIKIKNMQLCSSNKSQGCGCNVKKIWFRCIHRKLHPEGQNAQFSVFWWLTELHSVLLPLTMDYVLVTLT